MARLLQAEHVAHPCAHLVGRRAAGLVDNCHAEANALLDRPIFRPPSVFRIRSLVEDDEVAHPSTRDAIIATTSSGVFPPESMTMSKVRVSAKSIP